MNKRISPCPYGEETTSKEVNRQLHKELQLLIKEMKEVNEVREREHQGGRGTPLQRVKKPLRMEHK